MNIRVDDPLENDLPWGVSLLRSFSVTAFGEKMMLSHKVELKEYGQGVKADFVHGENVTLAFWSIPEGTNLPAHDHPHEQIVNLLEGEFELTVGSETKRLTAGSIVVIPSGKVHSGRAVTSCRVIDTFHPVREDFALPTG